MTAGIELEGYPSSDYGYTTAVITRMDKEVQNMDGQNFFTVYMDIRQSGGIDLYAGMYGTANILISDKNILQKILKI